MSPETGRPGTKREMEHLQDFTLNLAVQVDHQVAADNQVDLRERRIRQDVVLGKQNDIAHFLVDPVMRSFLDEVVA